MTLEKLTYSFLIITILFLSIKAQACLTTDYKREFNASYTVSNGTIIDIHSRWNDKKTEIETVLVTKVDSAIEGIDQEIIHSVVPGGIIPEEGIALIVTGHDQFRLGDNVAVFSDRNSRHFVKKRDDTHALEEIMIDTVPRGFTYYCRNNDSLKLACGSDVCNLGVSWPRESIPVNYYMHSSFGSDQIEAVEAAMETWNGANTMFQGVYGGITELNEAVPDGINIIRFANEEEIPDYQLARCHIWTDLEGKILDVDISLNPHSAWGTIGKPGECDIQSILTHEIGHFIGLGDIYDPGERLFMTCMGKGNKNNTMYGFSGRGERKKRTLALGDLIGIQSLYGCAVTIALEGDERALNSIRYFVDSFLIKTEWGKDFIDFYYEISPQFSSYFTANPKMKLRAKNILHAIIPVIETFPSFKETLSE